MNTLNWGLQRAQQKYSIRHTEKIRAHVQQARRVLDLSIDYYRQFKHSGDELASERFTEAQLRRVLEELYPSGTDDTASDRTRRSREQTKQRITELFAHGDTQGNAPGTKWAAVNAIIEHADWIRPVNADRNGSPGWSTTAREDARSWAGCRRIVSNSAERFRQGIADRLPARIRPADWPNLTDWRPNHLATSAPCRRVFSSLRSPPARQSLSRRTARR